MVMACHFFACDHWRGFAGSCSQSSLEWVKISDGTSASVGIVGVMKKIESMSDLYPKFPSRAWHSPVGVAYLRLLNLSVLAPTESQLSPTISVPSVYHVYPPLLHHCIRVETAVDAVCCIIFCKSKKSKKALFS